MGRYSRTSLAPENTRSRRAHVEDRREPPPQPRNRVRVAKAPVSDEPEPTPVVVGSIDPVLAVLAMLLVAFGMVMIYSASAVNAAQKYGDGYHFLWRQLLFAGVALPLMITTALFDYHRLPKYALLLGSFVLLCATLLGFGHTAGGASRWLRFGSFGIQPAEFAKVAVVVWLAWSLSNKAARMKAFGVGLVPHVFGAGVLALLCLRQPDFGSAAIIMAITVILLLIAGVHLPQLLGVGAVLGAYGVYEVVSKEYRLRRVLAYLAPEAHRDGAYYQTLKSHIGFGSGGLTGVGIGDSKQKLMFLPEAHTDFISTIVAEELGFIGFSALSLAFAVLVWRGLRAAYRSVDDHGFYLAAGCTLLIAIQAATNLAVAVGLIPTKGLVLPFISAGGSSLVASCFALGIVLNVSRQRVPGNSAVKKRAGGTRRAARKRESMTEGPVGGVA